MDSWPADSIERRHRQRLLTGTLLAILAISVAYDLGYTLRNPGYLARMGPFVLVTKAMLVGLLLLSWRGSWWPAAVGLVAFFPTSIAIRLVAGLGPDPSRTLSYLALNVVVASLLFSGKGTVVVGLVNAAVIGLIAMLRPDLPRDTLVGYAIFSIVVAGLLAAAIAHRARIEAVRQSHLAASEARKSAVLDTALDCIVAIDAQGRILEFNPAAERTFGFTKAEALGRDLAALIVPDDQREPHRAGILRHLTDGSSRMLGRRLELSAKRSDGTVFPCELAIAASGSGAGTVFTAYIRDLTGQKDAEARHQELEEQLRESQKMLAVGQLAGGIAHDFNNTLHAIGAYVSLAKDSLGDSAPRAVADLEEAEKATKQAAGLTRQLLAFSRRQMLDLQVTAVNEVIDEFLGIVRRVMTEQVTLRFLPGAELPAARLDRGQIQQVLLNLCLNARDAMPDGGDLTLETELVEITPAFAAAHPWARAGTFVAMVVADTGVGMTPEVQTRMFEPFFTTKGTERGTGLGLAVVYGIVQQHQGFIRVDSGPGVGTSIRVYLPASSSPAALPPVDLATPPVGGRETILIADDADAIRDVMKRTLQSGGYRVIVAGNGDEAVRLFERAPGDVDLVVLDAIMPHRSGRDAYLAMRAIRPDLPALFVSGYSADTIDAGWLAEVNAELVMKPVSPPELLRRVRRALDARRSPVESSRS